jgi:PilZ domain
MIERRKMPRVSLAAKVESGEGRFAIIAAAGDISEGGMLIYTANPWTEGQTVALKFILPGSTRTIRTKGTLVHVVPQESMRVRFEGLQPEDLEEVRRYVKRMLEDPTSDIG